ncbi:MAG TPA: sporulation protein [Halococcus sp.]|nr:sporulation protein [Halococcus sp.]
MGRVLSRIGVGGATVDTILPDDEFSPGERVTATVEMVGGDSEQTIENVYLKLIASTHDDETEHVLDTYDLLDETVILAADETKTIETELRLPLWTPITTTNGITVRIDTGLDIEWAVDATDADKIDIVPDEFTDALFTAIEELGFAHYGTYITDEESWVEDRPLVQKFMFVPESEPFDTYLDVLGITCLPREEDLRVAVEINEIDITADDPELEAKAEEGAAARLLTEGKKSIEDIAYVGDSPRDLDERYGEHDPTTERKGTIANELDLDFDKQEVTLTFENPYPDQIQSELNATIRQHTDQME